MTENSNPTQNYNNISADQTDTSRASIPPAQLNKLWNYSPGDKLVLFRVTDGDPVPIDFETPTQSGNSTSPDTRSETDDESGRSEGAAKYRHGSRPTPTPSNESAESTQTQTSANDWDTTAPAPEVLEAESIPSAVICTVSYVVTQNDIRTLGLDIAQETEAHLPDNVTGATLQFVHPEAESIAPEITADDAEIPLPIFQFDTEPSRAGEPTDGPEIPPVAINKSRCAQFGSPEVRKPAIQTQLGRIDYMGTKCRAVMQPTGEIRMLKGNGDIREESGIKKVSLDEMEEIERITLPELREFTERGIITPLTDTASSNIEAL